jgi:predicted Co/Zn/Cd cation transporter (cation efflux family)
MKAADVRPGAATQAIELRSLAVSKWANLFMAACGIFAAWLSNSEAILLDGLFSGIGFVSAIVAARVGVAVNQPPDRRRPFGYDADEAIYTTFRSLTLLGLIVFAAFSAITKIITFARGGDLPELVFGPIIIYFVVISTTCLSLTILHYINWKRTGKKSEILKLESNAAKIDGFITAAAGLGLIAIPFLAGTPLEAIIPIGDSIILLLLCAMIIAHPVFSFRRGLAELAGISAAPKSVRSMKQLVRAATTDMDLRIVDVSVNKLGRTHTVAVYVDPVHPVTAGEMDQLTTNLEAAAENVLGSTRVYVVVSKYGRAWAMRT